MSRRVVAWLPVGLSALRLTLVPWLLRLARRGRRGRWCSAVAALVVVDLADGILARRLAGPPARRRQRRVDGLADAALLAVAPPCAHWLRPEALRQERLPFALLAGAQIASLATCYATFGRLPRYHTAAFRWSAGALGVALASRIAGGPLALSFRPAVAALALAHLEALAITLLLDRYQQPVRTVLAARRLRRAARAGAASGRPEPSDSDEGARHALVAEIAPAPGGAAGRTEPEVNGPRRGRADLHLHTTASDGLIPPEALLEAALAAGLDVIAVTDHDRLDGAWRVRDLAARRHCPLEVIVGVEVTTTWGVHLLGLFVERPVPMYLPPEAAMAAIVAQGGLCLAPHPLSPLTPSLGRRAIDRLLAAGAPLVGVETVNPTPAGRIVRRQVATRNAGWRLAEYGGSDAHFLPHVCRAYTSFPGRSAAALRAALLAGTTAGHETPSPAGRLSPMAYAQQVRRSMVRSPLQKLRRGPPPVAGGHANDSR